MQKCVKAFNPQIFLEFLCYSAFGGLMLYLIRSDKYLSYVTPRMKPYLYFTAILMGIWALAVLGRMFRPQHKVRTMHCFVIVIPLLLLLLPHAPLSTADLSGNYIGGSTLPSPAGSSSSGGSQDEALPADSNLNDATDTPTQDHPSNTIPWEDTADLSGLDIANKQITVSNEDFGRWMNEIYMDMEKYNGYTITITGFVFKDPDIFKENEFVPARLVMTCCVADLAPVGLLCKYDKASELETDSWVTVQGTLEIGQYEYDGVTYDEPQIHVTGITPAETVEGYVYLY